MAALASQMRRSAGGVEAADLDMECVSQGLRKRFGRRPVEAQQQHTLQRRGELTRLLHRDQRLASTGPPAFTARRRPPRGVAGGGDPPGSRAGQHRPASPRRRTAPPPRRAAVSVRPARHRLACLRSASGKRAGTAAAARARQRHRQPRCGPDREEHGRDVQGARKASAVLILDEADSSPRRSPRCCARHVGHSRSTMQAASGSSRGTRSTKVKTASIPSTSPAAG